MTSKIFYIKTELFVLILKLISYSYCNIKSLGTYAYADNNVLTSCIAYLFLRACVIFSPLLRVPYRAAIRSASSTPEGEG